jgi:uncharacterized protein
MTADQIKSLLHLEPHPVEGGWFRRTYTSAGSVELARGMRAQGTAIYYLLEAGTFSEMHVLASDEIFHFYFGDPVEMLQLHEDGRGSAVFTLGGDLAPVRMCSSWFRRGCGRGRGWWRAEKWRCWGAR